MLDASRWRVEPLMTIWPGSQASLTSLEHVLTTSPSTVYSRRAGDPMSPIVATPELRAMRSVTGGETSSAAVALRIALAARAARIADELVERALLREHRFTEDGEAAVQQLCHGRRRHVLGHARETHDVGEEDRDVALFGQEGHVTTPLLLEDSIDDRRRMVAL